MAEPVRIPAAELKRAVAEILMALDTPESKADLVADSLVAANLRGVDSHGVHLVRYYVTHIREGHLHPSAEGEIVSESGACLLFDGGSGFGQVVSEQCCIHAVRLAKAHGLGMAVARNSNHFGAAAYWGQQISAAGMMGFAFCNASASVPPWQGRQGRIGTNPICASMPSTGDGGWLLDMATTTVALNKILRAAANNEPSVPPGWAMNERGEPTTDAASARLLMPLGGYKGSGLGVLVEILCGVLGGGAMTTDVGGTFLFDHPMRTSQAFLAIDPERFLGPGVFQQRMEQMVTSLKSSAPATGYDEILVAGDPEWRLQADRLDHGIPLDPATWNTLNKLGTDPTFR